MATASSSIDYVRFARALLYWFYNAGRIDHREYSHLRAGLDRLARDVFGCQGKKTYTTFSEAEKMTRSLRRFVSGELCRPYHCRACGGFHIAHVDRDERLRRIQRQRQMAEEDVAYG